MDLFDANIDIVSCVSEIRSLSDSPAACDDAYRDATESLDRTERKEFRRKMAVYRIELERLLRENASHRATAKAGSPTKGRKKGRVPITPGTRV